MIEPRHFRRFVIRPTLEDLELRSQPAEELLLGTALAEMELRYLKQGHKQVNDGEGVALGLYSMEPETHDDIWGNYLRYRPVLSARVNAFVARGRPRLDQLVWNMAYATAMARIPYWRVKEALPHEGDAMALSRYHVKHYNRGGAADAQANLHWFERAVAL